MDRISSAIALANRGINIDTCACSSCIDGVEDVKQILVMCPYAIVVTDSIIRWCGINKVRIQNISELLLYCKLE